jgi:hypothetical protein
MATSDPSTDKLAGTGSVRTRWIRDHIGVLTTLVDAVGDQPTFRSAELPQPLTDRINLLHRRDIITIDGREVCQFRDHSSERIIWRVERQALIAIEYWRHRVPTYPCGHAATGFRNPRDEPGYRCPRSWCDVRLTRSTIKRCFNG